MSPSLQQRPSGFQPGVTLDRAIASWKEPLDDALLRPKWNDDGSCDAAAALRSLAFARTALGPIDDPQAVLATVAPWLRPSPLIAGRADELLDTLDEQLPEDTPPLELLPYVLDPHAVGSRLRVLRQNDRAIARQQRKESGAFFTPPDLADHMVDLALRDNHGDGVVLDPACGSGAFLAAAMRWFAANTTDSGLEVISRLRGIDIDPSSISAARLVVAANAAASDGGKVFDFWEATTNVFTKANAFDVGVPQSNLMAVIMNPPYGPVGTQSDLHRIDTVLNSKVPFSAGTPMYVPFTALGLALAKQNHSRLVAVVPLAIASNTTRPFPDLRTLLDTAGGGLRFSFFDRTPDSIFGDHVKTRACVLEWEPRGDDVQVTSLIRWSSTNRHRLFGDLNHVPLGRDIRITDGIPRLGTPAETRAFRRLQQCSGHMFCSLSKARRFDVQSDNRQIYIAGTAYNWLTILRHAEAVRCSDSASPIHTLTFPSVDHADAAFATLNSRIMYWLWACMSDAFHVTRRFLARAPWPTDPNGVEALSTLGRRLSLKVTKNPVVSINKGRTTVSFDPESQPELRDSIDATLGVALGLEPSFISGLRSWLKSHVDAGRTVKQVME